MALPALAAGIIGALIPSLISGIVWLVKRVLVALGVGFVAYQGMQPMVDYIVNQVIALVTANDQYNIAEWLGVMRVGESISIILSALTFAMTIKVYERVMMRFKPSGT